MGKRYKRWRCHLGCKHPNCVYIEVKGGYSWHTWSQCPKKRVPQGFIASSLPPKALLTDGRKECGNKGASSTWTFEQLVSFPKLENWKLLKRHLENLCCHILWMQDVSKTALGTFKGCIVVTSHVHYSRLSICCVEIWTCPQYTRQALVSNVRARNTWYQVLFFGSKWHLWTKV